MSATPNLLTTVPGVEVYGRLFGPWLLSGNDTVVALVITVCQNGRQHSQSLRTRPTPFRSTLPASQTVAEHVQNAGPNNVDHHVRGSRGASVSRRTILYRCILPGGRSQQHSQGDTSTLPVNASLRRYWFTPVSVGHPDGRSIRRHCFAGDRLVLAPTRGSSRRRERRRLRPANSEAFASRRLQYCWATITATTVDLYNVGLGRSLPHGLPTASSFPTRSKLPPSLDGLKTAFPSWARPHHARTGNLVRMAHIPGVPRPLLRWRSIRQDRAVAVAAHTWSSLHAHNSHAATQRLHFDRCGMHHSRPPFRGARCAIEHA